ncbi:MAG: acetate--CoA ligase family protein [Candidatus Micrarchaeota archaeon]|nr:acetate--CoA ligase family protein [Candidatus Micrarchaeota archaeon]
MMDPDSEMKMFSALGLRMPAYAVVRGNERPALFPAKRYVIKAYGEKIVHKTDLGAIKAGVEKASVELEMRRMRNRLISLGIRPEGFIIQEQVPKGLEVIIGGKRDPQFGDVVLFGMGGVYVELYKDFSVRLCPLSTEDAVEMIDETRAGKLLAGFRGSQPISKEMVAGIMKKVCTAMHRDPGIREVDLNPVILYPGSYCAVDVRVIR